MFRYCSGSRAYTHTRARARQEAQAFSALLRNLGGQTCTATPIYPPTHTHIPTGAHTHARHRHARANIHHMRALAHADCACARALAQARIRTHARARTHAHAHAHGHAHAHAHTRFLINSGSLVEMLDCGKRIGPTPRICHSWQEQNNETTAPFEGTRGTQVRPEASLRMSARCLDPVRWAVDQGMRTAPLPSLSFPSEQGFHTHSPAMLGASDPKQHTQGAKGTTAKNQRNRVRKRRVR